MSDLELTDKLSDFPTQYNADIDAINSELHFKTDGADSIKYTGTATISGDLDVTGNVTGNWVGNLDASTVYLSGGDSVQDVLSVLNNETTAILDQARDFERNAEEVRRKTPSGFSKEGTYTDQNDLSSLGGLVQVTTDANKIRLGHSGNGPLPEVVVNGYNIIISGLGDNITNVIDLPDAPATGTRQDLVFIEVWKEEVDKDNGLLFPYGNTQFSPSADVDGSTLSETHSGYTGSAYFTPTDGIYAVRSNTATEAFLSNPDHNISVTDSGKYIQVRYRIRVEAGVNPSSIGALNNSALYDTNVDYFTPQGQLSIAPTQGAITSTNGIFQPQTGEVQAKNTINDKTLYLGGKYTDDSTIIDNISGLSYDGFSYAIPVCAISRRNKGVYSNNNQNGTAYDNAWTVAGDTDFASGQFAYHGFGGQTLVTVGTSTFKIVGSTGSSPDYVAKLVRIFGSETPSGSATWDFAGSTRTASLTIISVDVGEYAGNDSPYASPRSDGLYSDTIDRRDVLDLRHKVGKMNEDVMYQETFDLVMKGEYRQEWEKQVDYDYDGDENNLTTNNIHGNVLLESLGLGQSVPSGDANTNITKLKENNNGTLTGFMGARTLYSDQEGNEDYTIVVPDQSNPDVLDSQKIDLATFNEVSNIITIDLTEHDSYINDLTKDPTSLAGHAPVVKWGNGANVAGEWTNTDDYNWSFEVKEYGAVEVTPSSSVNTITDTVYSDSGTTKQWIVEIDNTGTSVWVRPDYTSGNDGDVLPSGTLTLVSGTGDSPITINSTSRVTDTTTSSSLGYSNTEHGVSLTESIFLTFKLNYKAGSSCLPELPYGDDMIVKGATLHIDGGEAVTMPESVRPMKGWNKETKTLQLNGFAGRQPVIQNGGTGEFDSANAYRGSVVKDGSTYKMWYSGSNSSYLSIGYATSVDGLNWEKQGRVLDVAPATFYADSLFSPTVIKDGSTYKMWFAGLSSSVWRIGYATSTDGIAWTVVTGAETNGSVLDIGSASDFDEQFVHYPNVIKDGATYKMWYTGTDTNGSGQNTIGYATSSDGETWAKQGQVLGNGPNSEDFDDFHTESGNVIKDGDVYKMFYTGYNQATTTYAIGYALSTDGENWIKKGTILENSADAVWDSSVYSASVIKDGKSYKMWYTGQTSEGVIGYAVLGMTHYYNPIAPPYNTEERTLGTYINTDPSVNFGFKSLDSIVLNYDRKSKQTYGDSISGRVYPKYVVQVENNIPAFYDFGSGYSDFDTLYNATSSVNLSGANFGLDQSKRSLRGDYKNVSLIVPFTKLDSGLPESLSMSFVTESGSNLSSLGNSQHKVDVSNSESTYLVSEYIFSSSSDKLVNQLRSFSMIIEDNGTPRILVSPIVAENKTTEDIYGATSNSFFLIGRPSVK